MAPTINDLLIKSEQRLQDVDSPRLSAEVLLVEVLGCSRLSLYIERDRMISAEQLELFHALVSRREQGEPLAYILGQKEFYGLDFIVSSETLIPRPETEHLVETVEELFDESAAFHFVDLGTGSGIIAVVLANIFKKSSGIAVDLSSEALAVAKKNAIAHRVDKRLEFIRGDFTEPLFEKSIFDLVVSNPPYVPQHEYDAASVEVTGFEPVSALVSGVNGLDHIHAMLPHVSDILKQGGFFLMEIGYQQAGMIKRIVTNEFREFKIVSVIKDLARHDRIVMLQKI